MIVRELAASYRMNNDENVARQAFEETKRLESAGQQTPNADDGRSRVCHFCGHHAASIRRTCKNCHVPLE